VIAEQIHDNHEPDEDEHDDDPDPQELDDEGAEIRSHVR
jgi:hypothetical protein